MTENETTTVFFPDIDLLDVINDNDFRDKPASSWSVAKIGTLQVRIEQFLSSRRKGRSKNLNTDIPLHRLLSIANDVFGFDGWSNELMEFSVTEYMVQIDGEREGHCLQVEAIVRITLKDGTYHEAIGKGRADNLPTKAMAYMKAKKSAVTDATKIAIHGFKSIVLDHEQKLRVGFYDHDVVVF